MFFFVLLLQDRRMPFKRRLKRRTLDLERTLLAYEQRMLAMPREEFEKIRDKYLSSFQIYETYSGNDLKENRELRRGTHLDNSTFRLSEVAEQRGVPIRGITSQRKADGKRIAALSSEEEQHILYVGRHNAFTNDKSNSFSLTRFDKRYEK